MRQISRKDPDAVSRIGFLLTHMYISTYWQQTFLHMFSWLLYPMAEPTRMIWYVVIRSDDAARTFAGAPWNRSGMFDSRTSSRSEPSGSNLTQIEERFLQDLLPVSGCPGKHAEPQGLRPRWRLQHLDLPLLTRPLVVLQHHHHVFLIVRSATWRRQGQRAADEEGEALCCCRAEVEGELLEGRSLIGRPQSESKQNGRPMRTLT